MNESWLDDELRKRKNLNNYRELKLYNENGADFFSNDYLGFSRNREIQKLFTNIYKNSTNIGGTGSRLISGNNSKMIEVENYLAKYYNAEKSLVFQSGYLANLVFFSTVPTKNDTVIYDSLIHASIRDGIKLGNAHHYSFKHLDYNDLSQKIKRAKGRIFLVIEGIYSMDGDSPSKNEIKYLVEKHDIYLIIDEAHSLGILGETGKGWSEGFPNDLIFARIYTFGKALGFHGACIVGSQILINFIINFGRGFIYTTAPSTSFFKMIQSLHQYLEANYKKEKRNLEEKIDYYLAKIHSTTIDKLPIQIIQGDNIYALEKKLLNHNMLVKLIKTPTVAKGQERIRLVIHNFNTFEEIDTLTKLINE